MARSRVGVAVAVVLALAGCTTSEAPSPDPSSTGRETSTTSLAGAAGSVVAEVPYLGETLHLEVAPVQVKDGVALLTADVSLGSGAAKGTKISIGGHLNTPNGADFGAGGVRLVDLATSTVFPVGRDSAGRPAATEGYLALTPGAPVRVQVFFRAPSSTTVAVLFPYLGLVPDVPVVRLGGDDELAVTPAGLGASGDVSYSSAPIDAYSVALDHSSSAEVTGDAVTVTLASDVLFATDQYALTAQAQAVVDAAATRIATAAQVGEVSVVGHTDDVGTDAYNQDLSVRRAQAVTDRLVATLGTSFQVRSEGRGESEPVAQGSSAAARAANRRVEIRFTAKTPGVTSVAPVTAPTPPATGPTASGNATVDVTGTVMGQGGFSVRARSVKRVGKYLVGSLEIGHTSAGSGVPLELLGDPTGTTFRGFSSVTMSTGAFAVAVLGAGARYFPAEYVSGVGADSSTQRGILADEHLGDKIPQGKTITATVIWPDPGGDAVTIDAPLFRLTDVPVTEP